MQLEAALPPLAIASYLLTPKTGDWVAWGPAMGSVLSTRDNITWPELEGGRWLDLACIAAYYYYHLLDLACLATL